MPCKSGNIWFKILNNLIRPAFFPWAALLGIALSTALSGHSAWAVMNISGYYYNSVQETNIPAPPFGVTTFTGYWAITPFNPSTSIFDSSDSSMQQPINLSNNAGNDTNALDTVLFTMVADKAMTPGTPIDVMVFTSQQLGGFPVPIAFYNNGSGMVPCNGEFCDPNLWSTGHGEFGGSYYYGVPYIQNANIEIGIFVGDLCNSWNRAASTLIPTCTNILNNTALQADTALSIPLTVQLVSIPPGAGWENPPGNFTNLSPSITNLGNPPVQLAANHVATLTLNMQNAGPTAIQCPLTGAQQDGEYIPGDTQIQLNTGVFTMTPPQIQTGGGIAAPAAAMVIVASGPTATLNDVGPSVSGATGPTASEILNRVQITGGDTTVGPGVFQNTQGPSDPNYYNLNFFVRDNAGFLTPGNAGCQLSNVQTSAIQGFLGKSSCFIATAAFRSIESAPVAMLRGFRDRILLHHLWGRGFVHWYYSWSPPAAEWLMLHPAFRYPVLLALVPLEVVAWLWLHPLWILLIGFPGFIGLLGLLGQVGIRDRGSFGGGLTLWRSRADRERMR